MIREFTGPERKILQDVCDEVLEIIEGLDDDDYRDVLLGAVVRWCVAHTSDVHSTAYVAIMTVREACELRFPRGRLAH